MFIWMHFLKRVICVVVYISISNVYETCGYINLTIATFMFKHFIYRRQSDMFWNKYRDTGHRLYIDTADLVLVCQTDQISQIICTDKIS